MKVRNRIICIALTLVMLISTVPMASGASFALHGTEPEKSGVAIEETCPGAEGDSNAALETEIDDDKKEKTENIPENEKRDEKTDEVPSPSLKKAPNDATSKAAPVGVARLSGTETTYLSLVNSTFRFFKTDNIVLETSDDSFLYRVVVKNVECPEGGSYQWDGTMYTKDDEAGFVISDEDIHKKYGVTYQAQYLDTDDNKWKDLEGVAKYSEIIVRGGTEKKYVSGDEAYVERVILNMVASGTPAFDENNEPGNDMDEKNDIVRSFDTVKYSASFNTRVVDEFDTFRHGYLWVEITLPCTRDIAGIDTTIFSVDVKQAKEPYEIEKNGKTHTVYTFYYEKQTTVEEDGTINHALPQIGHFPFNMKVYGAKNGTHIKPTIAMAVAQLELDENGEAKKDAKGNFIVARDYSDFDGAYDIPKYAEGPDIKVSAKPGFNINLNRLSQNNVSRLYDFSTGKDDAIDREAGLVYGRAARFGINVSMMNDDRSKGMKGLELPDGSDITFELDMEAAFGSDAADAPLIWSVLNNGGADQYGRGSSGSYSQTTYVPKDYRKGPNEEFTERKSPSVYIWNGGDWILERMDNGKVKATIKDYVVNPLWFPTGYNVSNSGSYNYFMSGGELKCGVFSARIVNIVIPYGSNITDDEGNPRADGVKPEYAVDIEDPKYYPTLYNHDGNVNINISDSKLDITSQSGQKTLELYPGEKEGQTVYTKNDDSLTASALLARPSVLGSRTIWFGKNSNTLFRDVNGLEYAASNGKDAVMPGTRIRTSGSVIYTHRDNYETSWFGAGQVLIKFDDEHLKPQSDLKEGELFAVKPDGKGWVNDDELKSTGINELEYYKTLKELQESDKVCVGVLKEVRTTGSPKVGSQGFTLHVHDLLVTTDSKYYNTVSMTSMCTRLWRIDAYNKIVEMNGEFPSYTNSEMQGKTVEEYIAGKYNLSNEDKAAVSPLLDDLGSKSNLGYVKASYDEEGYHKGSGTEPKWGDSLYIIPYKMGIRKFVEQKNGPNSTDSVGFSFENGETVADFCLHPYFELPEGDNGIDIELSGTTTKVTITDELPAGLTYVAGSAYIGGSYENNTPNRGGRGTVIGGRQLEPVLELRDGGKTLLKWEMNDVEIGNNEAIPVIHFSADMDQEITDSTDWINKGCVRSTEDNREYNSNNRNLDTAKINAAPAGNFITRKVAENLFNEQNEELKWTLRWKNTTGQIYTNRVMMDIMPYNGDPRGTQFSGSYKITDLRYSFLKDLKTEDYRFYYSTDAAAREGLESELPYSGFVGDAPTVGGISWKKAEIEADGKVSEVIGMEDITAFLVIGDVSSKGEVRASVTIKPEGNQPGDKYFNAIAANEMIHSSGIYIVRRGLRGNVWKETRGLVDGCRQAGEQRLGDVKVVLKMKNSNGEWDEYATTETDSSGRYEFIDLPAGMFKVEFVNSGGRDLTNYRATIMKAENVASSQNSDATPLYGDEVFAEIDGIEMPEAENINTSPYFVEYQDLGVWRPELAVSKTVDASADENEAAMNREFLFRLKVPGGGDDETFKLLNTDGESAGQVTGAELEKGYVFRLRHNESILFTELPANVSYELEEYDYEANGFGYKRNLAAGSDSMRAALDQDREVNVINIYAPETTELDVSKQWDETQIEFANGYSRPESIRATLTKDGAATEEHRELSADNDWKDSFAKLPKYNTDSWPESFDADAAKEISYTVEETLVGDDSYVNIDGERRFYFYNDDKSVIGYFVSTSEDGVIVNKFVPDTNKVLSEYEPEDEKPEDTVRDEYVTEKDGDVKTGDYSHMMIWIVLLIVSAFIAIAVLSRRSQNN